MKQKLKNLLLDIGTYLHKNSNSKVLYYHDIHSNNRYTAMSTSLDLFNAHIEMAKREGYRFVKKIDCANKEILVTFDDGFRGLYENFSYFQENSIPVKIFLILDYLDKPNYLMIQEVKEMLETGLVTIGSHTLSHRNLDELSNEEIENELRLSKERLEELFNVTIDELCYPRGRFDDRVILQAKECGYKLQYSCLPGSYNKPFVEGVIKRNFVQHESPKAFHAYLKGGGEIFYGRYLKQHYRSNHAH